MFDKLFPNSLSPRSVVVILSERQCLNKIALVGRVILIECVCASVHTCVFTLASSPALGKNSLLNLKVVGKCIHVLLWLTM